MQGVGRWALQRAARNSIATLASSGLVNEGIYLAVKTLAEGWRQPVADTLVSGFRSALESSEERTLEAWNKVVASQRTSDPIDDLLAQLAVQSPKAWDFIRRRLALGSADRNLGRRLVRAGTELIDEGMFGAGLSFLSSAAYGGLAGRSAIPALRDAIAQAPQQDAKIVSGRKAQTVKRDLSIAATQLAATDHYVSALHANLLEPLLDGDNTRFALIGTRILRDASPYSGGASITDRVDLALDLCRKGYRSQAVDLVTASTDIPYVDQSGWRRMYLAMDKAQRTSGARRLAARIVPPVATRMGLDLSPVPASTPSAAPEASSATLDRTADGSSRRHVNCWIEESRDFPADEFDVGVNIGPRESGAQGGPFHEPDWNGREHVDLRIVLSGPDAQIRPAWRQLRLARTGKTEDVHFRVTSSVVGVLQLWLRVYAEETNTLLDEHQLRISIADSRQVA